MSHSHHSDHKHSHHEHRHERELKTAFFLNLIFTLIEFAGGFFSGSIAIVTDAVHDLGDTLAIGSALFFEKKSRKGRDKTYTYGYGRYSPMAAFINGLILISGSVIMLSHAIPALLNPKPVNTPLMLVIAVVGILFNGLAVWKLHAGHHHHAHHSHNRHIVMLHLLEDTLGWAAVLLGSIIIYFTEWYIIDPILSILIALFILYNAVKNLRSTASILLQAIPDPEKMEKLQSRLQQIPGVENVHDLHYWTLDGNKDVLTVHLKPNEKTDVHSWKIIQDEACNILREFKVSHYTVQIDFDKNCDFKEC
jgi:cobalt-zinc-cadmium efflux system protein